jgi:hypothetical protein
MGRPEFIRTVVIALVGIVAAFVSYRYGVQGEQATQKYSVAYAQATVALADYKALERIESLVQRKCYEAALTEAREQKHLQVKLLSDNLSATENAPELVEYIKVRDSKVLEAVQGGRIPEPEPYATTCP